jgi:hypothetical protein
MVIVLVVLALLTGALSGVFAAVAVARTGDRRAAGPSPALRQLSALREQLQTEHAVALASSDTRAALAAGYPWQDNAPAPHVDRSA